MKLYLLTHQRETLKNTNTGQLVQQLLPEHCETIIWQRKAAEPQLLQLLDQQAIAVLFPDYVTHQNALAIKDANDAELPASDTATSHDKALSGACRNIDDFENFIIIDSTWQQARKMMNQSPYLQAMPRVTLESDSTSSYTLRRNQRAGGLCTAEAAIALCQKKSMQHQAEQLQAAFTAFNSHARNKLD